ncbi:DUF2334 domain-containing protein [Antrihabitans spumae]|uniref:DUF2334 domain-containing protein n=1 Tax=Antrihabitans spumae TaxID=3373370 RepID=A0ABW7KCU2_9NOCA
MQGRTNMVHGCSQLVVSVHDVAPATADETARWCADAEALGIPLSLLVIPGPWRGAALSDAPDYAEVLRARRNIGDEIVLHGWSHVAGPEGPSYRRVIGRVVARGAAEFAALNEQQAAERIAAGTQVLADLGLATRGFTPPGWLASPAANRALARAGFTHTTSHFGVTNLRTNRLRLGFALSHRPGGGWSERAAAALVVGLARKRAHGGGLVRIALHPDDLHRPGLRDASLRAIEAVVAAGAIATTYAEVVGR